MRDYQRALLFMVHKKRDKKARMSSGKLDEQPVQRRASQSTRGEQQTLEWFSSISSNTGLTEASQVGIRIQR